MLLSDQPASDNVLIHLKGMKMAHSHKIFSDRFADEQILQIDPRIRRVMFGWHAEYMYKGMPVTIPGTWGAEVYPYKYFEMFKHDGDPNPGADEDEIQLYMSGGWRGMDDEFQLNFMILGKAAARRSSTKVVVDIHRFSGEPMKIYRFGKLITDFRPPSRWWHKIVGKPDKVYFHRVTL